ncbi:MAG: polysaccharide lyase 6 family protein [Verrucomicrobiaceae bacterium]|nr:polysaccharide lyase 6 family protein [Verrucomicrobiaceae bacterium]
MTLKAAALLPALALLAHAGAKELPVADAGEFATVAGGGVRPGDVIVLAAGEWKDAALKLDADGTEAAPVRIKALTPGTTLLTGNSRLSISGDHIIVEGLWFKNPTGDEALEFRTRSDQLASDCRVTQCAVTNDLPADDTGHSARFASIYGARNRIDHCLFQGKTTLGTTMVVWLAGETTDQGRHHIDHNYFGPRPPLGKNGGETIRIGDSKTSMQRADCVVEDNVFERCDGEGECISNKSCGNLYQHNTFLAVSGTLTLRHGNDCTVQKNTFLGQGAKGTGGVRVIGERHRVLGNYFEGLRGEDERAALCFMLGIPSSPAHGYFQVKDARIEGNVFVNCDHPVVIGVAGSKTAMLPPVGVQMTGNFITGAARAIDARCDITGLRWKANLTNAKTTGIPKTDGLVIGGPKAAAAPETTISRHQVGPEWWKNEQQKEGP